MRFVVVRNVLPTVLGPRFREWTPSPSLQTLVEQLITEILHVQSLATRAEARMAQWIFITFLRMCPYLPILTPILP